MNDNQMRNSIRRLENWAVEFDRRLKALEPQVEIEHKEKYVCSICGTIFDSEDKAFACATSCNELKHQAIEEQENSTIELGKGSELNE